MGDKTGINWCDATWNPIRGCSRVSEGCRHCYAERVAARFCGPGQPYEGLVRFRSHVSGLDYAQRSAAGDATGRWSGEVRMVPEHLSDPLRWKRPRHIFVNSMSDLFHERLTNEQIAAVFGVMAAAPQHTFLVLTKRAKRMREWFEWVGTQTSHRNGTGDTHAEVCRGHAWESMGRPRNSKHDVRDYDNHWPLPNVWLGVSVENQHAADERIPHLLATPAAVRWLSCEPLLGDVHVDSVRVADGRVAIDALRGLGPRHVVPRPSLPGRIDWVVAGCESGPGARPCSVEWLRSLRDQCASAGVPFWLKQARQPVITYGTGGVRLHVLEDITAGPGSKRKPGGIIDLPYLDGVQHAAKPEVRP